jgi:hypothetical protein
MKFKTFILLILILFNFNSAISQIEEEESMEISTDENTVEKSKEDKSWKFKQMPFSDKNKQVPREFWDTVKNILIEDGAKAGVVDNFAILPISVQVELFSEDSYVLKDKMNHRLLFVEGGGDLDLFEYVTGKGPFSIQFTPGFESESKFHMLYISESPEKKVNGDLWGNGCGKIYDLSKKANDFMINQGIRVTSSRKHYLHLMAGLYIIFQLVDERLYLGYIHITDSRYPQFKCRESQE